MPRLGDILVSLQICTEAQIREGLENQVIFGGRLGTNLLEIGHLTEEQLARALGRRHGRPCLYGNLAVDPAALRLLGPDVVDRLEVIPYIVQDRKLAVLVRDPDDLAVLDEVAFATGKKVHPIVAPEARIWSLMRRLYRLDRQLRGIEIDGSTLRRPVPARAPEARKEAEPARDLMDQAEFDALYARVADAPPLPAGAAPPEAFPDEVVELTDLVAEPPAATPPPGAEAAREEVLAAMEAAAGHAPRPSFTPRPGSLEAVRIEPEPPPLGFAEAIRSLEGVADRDAIAQTVVRYARSHFRRALLLTVHRGAAAGWEGLGEGLDRRAVRRVRVPLGTPGVLDTVVRSQAHFLGSLQKTDANLRFLKAIGGGVPRNAFVIPILSLGRVVNVLYADNGRGELVDASDVGELLILATKIAQSYDTLLRRAL